MKKVLFSLVTLLLLSVSGIAQTTFTKITSASDLEAGANYLIVAHHDDFGTLAMGYQKSNNRNAVVVAESGDAITVTLGTDPTSATDVFQFTLGGGAGAWTFFDEVKEGYLYAASSSGNQLKTQTTLDANGQWSITFNSDGTAEVVAQGENTRNNMRFNPNTSNGDPLFSCYLESSNVDTRVSFYKAGGTSEPDHAFVDLGLPSGTLWATCNVGADTPEGYGDHFAWGETQPKDYYGWNTYQYCNGSGSSLTKYCSNSSYGYNGFTDNLTTLLPEDDAATVNWGDGWRMPTEEEWQELFQNTPYTLSTQNGVNGWLFTASNGNSLFMPFPGYLSNSSTYFAGNYGYYWSSSLCTPQPNYAYYLYCGSDGDYGFYSNFGRGRGLSVRAVRSGSPVLSYTINVMANPEEGGTVTGDGTYNQGATCTLTATANNGYSFTNWTQNGTEVSTNHSYSFTVTEDATFVANFSALDNDPLTYSINDDGVSVTVTGHVNGTAASGPLIIPETKTIDGVTYTVTAIKNDAFRNYRGLTGDLVIPNSVVTIGSRAFMNCSGFTSLTLGNSLTTISIGAFSNCNSFTGSLILPESLTIIVGNAFQNCSGFTGDLTIPAGVTSLGGAFAGCSGFTSLTMLPTVPPVNNPFGSSPYDIPVTVPCGSWSLYRYAYDWTGFTSIQEDCSGTYEVMATANPTEGGSVIFGTEGETLFADSFGSYTAGSTIAAEAAAVSHDWWTTWSGQTGGDDDGMVVDYGGTRCGHLTYGNDQVLLLNKESGVYDIEFDILVPEGKNAFFSFLHQFDETVNEAVYCHLHMTNANYQNTVTPYHGSIRAGNYNLTDIPCVFDAWMHFRFHVDMDADIARCYYTAPDSEEMLLCQWPWSWNSNTAAYTDSGLAAMDFWPPMDEASSEYYIDNFCLKQYEVGNTMLPGNHFAPGSTCTLTAVANEDYTFSNWTENGNMVSTDATYSFTVTDDRTLVANFNQATPTNYVITATANPTEGGTVTIGGMAHLLFDSFEMYNLGSKLSVAATTVGHDWWTTWSNYPGSLEDGVVANYNGTQCAHFTYGNDQILLLGNAVSGLYDLQFDVLVPNGKNGYFNVMHHFAGSQSSWAMECYLHMTNDGFNSTSAPGHGTVNAGSIGTCDLPCVYDEWMHYRIHIDIDNDVAQLYFNVFGQPEVKYAEWQWSLNIFGTEVVDGTIEAVDFYPPQNYSTSEFYVDNVRFSQFNGRYSTANNDGHIFAEMNSERDVVRNYEYYEYGATCTLNAMANEGYSFVNWTKNDSVVSTNNSYSFTVTEDATFVANFIIDQSEITQTTAFTEGWNWWSTYIEMAGIDGLGMLENGLGTNGISIKSQSNGYTEFYEDYDLWYGSLESINNESSYLVKTSAPCQVSMTGAATVPSQHPITVDADGWTWIGYPVAYDMDINTALGSLASIEGDMLKAQEGYAEFYEGYGWFGSLETLTSGMGYMYKSTSTSPITFTYPNNGRTKKRDNITSENNHWESDPSAYPFNMTVTAVVELDGAELRSDRYELAAFANGESRGSVRLMYVEPIDRYVAFLTIAGEEAADLSLSLYDTETGFEYFGANEALGFEANATLGRIGEPFVVSFRGTTGMDELANSLRVYPNPVNAGERFSIGMGAECKAPVRVEIVNALGVETLRATSVQMPATLTAPATAGIYTLRVTVDGKGMAVRKLVVK